MNVQPRHLGGRPTLATETGASLRASGFTAVAAVRGHEWTSPSRPRQLRHHNPDRIRWERVVNDTPNLAHRIPI